MPIDDLPELKDAVLGEIRTMLDIQALLQMATVKLAELTGRHEFIFAESNNEHPRTMLGALRLMAEGIPALADGAKAFQDEALEYIAEL